MNPFKPTSHFQDPKIQLYTTEDMAHALNCSPVRVRKLAREHKIHPILPTIIISHPAEEKRSRYGAYRFTFKEMMRAKKLYRLGWLKKKLYDFISKL